MNKLTLRALALTMRGVLAFVLLLQSMPVSAAGAKSKKQGSDALAIVGATVFDGTGREPYAGTVLVRGGRIEAAGPSVSVPAGARIVRAEGQTLLPGLFDLHTHMPYATAPGISGDWGKNLKAYLYSGVTTVVDFGTYPETFEPVRRLIASGAFEAPRVHFAARLTTPGGHGAEGGRGDFFTLEVQTPREARAAVRRLLPYRPDVIKVFTDGWRYNTAPDMTSMNEETLAAVCDEAHKAGVEVLTHTVTLARAKQAARAGVDALAHGIGDAEADEELIRIMREKGTTYVSTLAVYEPRGRNVLSPLLSAVLEPAVAALIDPPLSPAPPADDGERAPVRQQPAAPPSQEQPAVEATRASAVAEARRRRWRTLLHNVSALKAGGVRLGAGTDAGVTGTHHGWATLRELELLVRGGLTPAQALTAATLDSARALRVDSERGSIEPGKLADLVLVAGSPHRRISDIARVSKVFLGGREIVRERLASDIASPAQTAITPVKLAELVDDFEGVRVRAMAAGGPFGAGAVLNGGGAALQDPAAAAQANADDQLRSRLGTLWVNATDGGHDHSQLIQGITTRRGRDHALTALARMSSAARPFVRVQVPLTRGAVEPADARAWRGVRFDVRGDGGPYRLIVPTRGVRDSAYFQTSFTAAPAWAKVSVDFASLRQAETKAPAAWTGADLLMLSFEIARAPGEFGWLELDNIRFYK